jgi:hypothetical protein
MAAVLQPSASEQARGRNSRQPGSAATTDQSRSGAGPLGFKPLRWLHTLFSRPVRIKRVGTQLHVVLEAQPSVQSNSRSSGRGEALRLAHVALQELLAQHADSRRLMPHLGHVEQSLARLGSRALKTLPSNVLGKAMDQLDILEGSAQNPDLMALRLRVEEVLDRRTPARLRDDVSSIEVTDASHSQFDEADRHWTGLSSLDEAPAQQHAK